MNIVSTLTASNTVGKNVKFIWYEINPKDAIDVLCSAASILKIKYKRVLYG